MKILQKTSLIIVFISFFMGGCVTQSRFQLQVDQTETLADKNQKLSLQLQKMQDEHTRSEAEHGRLENEVGVLGQRIRDLRSQFVGDIDAKSKQVKDLEKQVEQLEKDLQFSIKIGSKNERELKNELIRLRGSFEGSLRKARRRVLDLESRDFEKDKRQSRLQVENDATVSELNRKQSSLQDLILEQDLEIDKLGEALILSQQDTMRLNQALEEKEEAYQLQLESLNNRIAMLNQNRLELNNKLQLSEKKSARKERELKEASQAHQDLVDHLKQEISDGSIKITRLKNSLSVEIVDKILFSSGSTQITPEGQQVLKKVSDVLRSIKENDIRIEGHTDDVPIGPGLVDRFASNWELSTARATQVVRFLSRQSVPSENMLAAGFSKYRPISSNETEEGRQRNRRIEIVLFPRDISKILETTE